jgi:NAD(P)-dependent dehydrogenase (short-subunit alcohol dehydrogenase family)
MKKNVLITGATKGIGLAAAQWLADRGYQVIGIARSQTNAPFPGKLFQCDLSKADETKEVFSEIDKKFSIDALINNVGTNFPQPLEKIDLDTYQMIMDLNVRSAVLAAQAFCQGMKMRKWGRIINISSRAIFGSANRTVYSAAKSALIGCTRTWALELAPFAITVNAVAPGPIETELLRRSRPKGSPAEKDLLAGIPMQRVGLPSEVAALIGFLLSEEAGYITGQTICIDGGGSL